MRDILDYPIIELREIKMDRLSMSFDDRSYKQLYNNDDDDESDLKKRHSSGISPSKLQTEEDSRDLRDILVARKSRSTPPRRHMSRINNPETKKRKLSFVELTAPMYKNYQLIGDSQFVRFAEQLLNYSRYVSQTEDTKSRCVGYCVSGQRIIDLEFRLACNNYEVHPFVMLMIGTNDILQQAHVTRMCETYEILLTKLKAKCTKILLLTIPPIPKLVKDSYHWKTLKYFNKFIQSKADGSKIFVIDVCSIFISYNNSILEEYFERTFYARDKIDLVHLNRNGFKAIRGFLNEFYFNND